MTSFLDAMHADDRNQADARAATAEQERDDALADRDTARAERDAARTDATVRIDTRNVIWHPAPNGQWHHPLYGTYTLDNIHEEYGPSRTALLIAIDDEQDEEQVDIAEARVLAALESLGWPDDRNDGTDYPGAAWEAVREAIAAADAVAPVPPARAQEPTQAAPEQPGHDDQCTPPLCAACGCWCHLIEQAIRARLAAVWPAYEGSELLDHLAAEAGAAAVAVALQHAPLPAWVLELVRGLERYEAEHPVLFRQLGGGYAQWDCPGRLLDLVPADVRAQADTQPAQEPTAQPTQVLEYHWGRAWSPTQDEATCPCPKAPCGYVIRQQTAAECEYHGPAQTMRGGHPADRCPAQTEG
ncbi:hypothetical protein [Micromonospora sp. NPDC003816]|uniref:hypothetical protein n=1 Tax=Micromonospora sp. NPDC003816 TaxID=3364224 RepID=UPI0036BCE3F0